MKKLFFAGLFILVASASRAQLSVTAGYAHTTLRGGGTGSLSNGGAVRGAGSFTIGLTYHSRINRYFGLQHAASYIARNTDIRIADGSHPVHSSRLRRSYIDVLPCSPSFSYRGWQLYAGPYMSILLSASLERKNADGQLYRDRSFYGNGSSTGPYSQKLDAGIAAGARYIFPFGLSVEGRWMRGFVPVVEDAALQQQWRIYNQTAVLAIGYRFP